MVEVDEGAQRAGPWIAELAKKMINFAFGDDDGTSAESDTWPIFLDYIQKRKRDKIKGEESAMVVIGLTQLKKMMASKIWLFTKYNSIIFFGQEP